MTDSEIYWDAVSSCRVHSPKGRAIAGGLSNAEFEAIRDGFCKRQDSDGVTKWIIGGSDVVQNFQQTVMDEIMVKSQQKQERMMETAISLNKRTEKLTWAMLIAVFIQFAIAIFVWLDQWILVATSAGLPTDQW